jgi:hypothetical protein
MIRLNCVLVVSISYCLKPNCALTRSAPRKVAYSFQAKKRRTTAQDPAPGGSGAKRIKVDNKAVGRKSDKRKGK